MFVLQIEKKTGGSKKSETVKITENLNNSLAILEDTLTKSQSSLPPSDKGTEKPGNAIVGFISAKRAAKEMASNMKNSKLTGIRFAKMNILLLL